MPDRLDMDPHALRRLADGHDAAAERTRAWARQPKNWLKNFRASYGPTATPVERAMVRYHGAQECAGNAMADQHDHTNSKPGLQQWQDAANVHEQAVKHPVFADAPAVVSEMNQIQVATVTGVMDAPDRPAIPSDRIYVALPVGSTPTSERPTDNSTRS
ncbi:type VII secretion target [Nocardia sp. NPDC023852]|uniref:type VII secretion target n=1 Tax=Nocardia sp. NPDC023852 TaxID=3154697 RepID=UPI0033DAD2D4